MISLKPGVTAKGIQPELLLGLVVLDAQYAKAGYTCVITALTDGKHMEGSLHYTGQAADTRTRDISPAVVQLIVKNTKEALGQDYDVVIEGDHVHLEWDQK
mgnify:CR=1 FL=1